MSRDKTLASICESHMKHLVPNLRSKFSKPREPARPAVWKGMDDDEVFARIREARANCRVKSNRRDMETLYWFGIWRNGVFRFEARCTSNILCLLRAAATFYEAGDENSAHRIRSFVCIEYGFHIDSPETTEAQRMLLAERYSRRIDLLPTRFLFEGYRGMRRRRRVSDAEQITLEDVW